MPAPYVLLVDAARPDSRKLSTALSNAGRSNPVALEEHVGVAQEGVAQEEHEGMAQGGHAGRE